MDVSGAADILLRNDDDFAKFIDGLREGKLSPEDGMRIVSFWDPIVREARKESREHSDPEAAFLEITQAKYDEAVKELMQTITLRP